MTYLKPHSLALMPPIHHDKPSPSLGPGQRRRLSRGRRTSRLACWPWGLSGQVHVAHNLGLRRFILGLGRVLTSLKCFFFVSMTHKSCQ